jgi:CrcB protein
MHPFLYVAMGGALGAVSRYAVVLFFAEHWLARYHFATLLVNTVGSFVMLFFMALFMYKFALPLPVRLFVAVGFLGSFTTFSSFSYETIHLVENGETFQALGNVLLNNFASIGAGFAGFYLARSLAV